MGRKVITIRERTFAVECKSGSQLTYLTGYYERQSDEQLDRNAMEYKQDLQRRGIWLTKNS